MKKTKLLAAAMAVIMLMPMLMSCSSDKKKNNVVKAEDPWYESVRVKINKDIREGEQEGLSQICTSNDNIFYMYSLSPDRGGSSRTVLDKYDLNGRLVDRKKVICPEDYYIMQIYSLTSDPEGKTLNAVVWYHSGGGFNDFRFVDINTDTGKISNIKEIFNDAADLAISAKDSSLSGVFCIGDYKIAQMFILNDLLGYQLLLFKNTEYVAELDFSSMQLNFLLGGYSINESKNSVYAYGYEKGTFIKMEFDLNSGKLKSKSQVQANDADSVNFWEYNLTNTGDMCRIDSLGNIVKADVDAMTTHTMIDTNWYTPYFYPPDSQDHSFSSSVLSCDEKGAVILDYEWVTYGSDDYKAYEYFRILKKTEKNPNEGKKIIELALPTNTGITEYMSRSIYEFNESDNEYLIRIWDKSKTGYASSIIPVFSEGDNDQQVFQMIQELKGDEAPDLALNIQKNYAMHDEIFMDLSDFLDPEVMDKQYKNIIEAGRIGGKLYFLPVTLEIEGLVTNTDLLEDGAAGITFEDYDKLIAEKMNGFSPYDYPSSTYCNKRTFILSCIDTKRAIEGDKVEFGTEQFRATAKYAKTNFKYNNESEIPDDYIYKTTRYRGECYYTKIDDYLDFVHACFRQKKQYAIIGTPSVDASGPRFKALETISVSATTDVKDGCRKFINFLFSGKAFDSSECEFLQIVTNKEIMDKNIKSLTDLNNASYDWYMTNVRSGVFIPSSGYDKISGDKYATDDMRESFRKSLASISIYYYEDYTIVQFLDEELAPYYAGDRSIDDAIKYLNDRVTKYVREM